VIPPEATNENVFPESEDNNVLNTDPSMADTYMLPLGTGAIEFNVTDGDVNDVILFAEGPESG